MYAQLALIERDRGHVGAAFDASERLRAREMLELLARGRVSAPPGTSQDLVAREQDLRRRIGELTHDLEQSDATDQTLRGSEVSLNARKGALVVSVPFNDAADLDHDGDIVRMPCEAANAMCVSATGPTGAAGINGPWIDVDAIAPYSAFGRSAVSVAAPGGAGEVGQFRRMWTICTTTPTATTGAPACRARQAIAQPAGTSFAAPTVAGLAALLVAQLGHGNPALIRARILQSADDLGDPGVDPYYGKGRINIARALGLIQ